MLSPQIILSVIVILFFDITAISYFTGKEDNNETFFNAKGVQLQVFGMVTSLSGVTFISGRMAWNLIYIFKLLLDT